jgi:hypothetical protein
MVSIDKSPDGALSGRDLPKDRGKRDLSKSKWK